MNNQVNNVSFGAQVKFSTSPRATTMVDGPKLKKVEKMFAEQTKGSNGKMSIVLDAQGRIIEYPCASVSYTKGKYEDYFGTMRDKALFFDDNAKPQKLVNKLKNMLKFFEQRKNMLDLIEQKKMYLKLLMSFLYFLHLHVYIVWPLQYVLL